MFGKARIVKEIDSKNRCERVSRYNSEGKVTVAHQVDFTLSRSSSGVRIFTFSNMTQVKGPNEGQTSKQAHSYLYKVQGNKFIEIWGMLDADGDRPLQIIEWTKVKEKPPQEKVASETSGPVDDDQSSRH